jgi:uncharacterized protein (TIRG00374 family)
MKNKPSTSKLLFWLFFIVFFWIAVTYYAQTGHILKVLSSGRWYWIIPAVLCQIFYYPFYAYFAENIFRIFRVNMDRKEILPVYMASKFTDVALPISTFGMIAIFIRNGKKKNIPALSSGIAISSVMLFDVFSFVVLSWIILLTLFAFDQSRAYLLIPLLLLTTLPLVVILFFLRKIGRGKQPNKIFGRLIKLIAKLVGKGSIESAEIAEVIREIREDLKRNKSEILSAIYPGLIAHLINIATLTFIFLAFTGEINILAVLASYVAGLLFTIISITPQGVGVAEAIMIATLHSFGLEVSVAAVITLAFRSLLYWLPLFPGFYVFSRLELKSEK